MSVVNKMLRDLEAREQYKASSANYVPGKNSKHWVALGALLFLIMVLAASFAARTAFVPDTNTHKDEPHETQIEKLPTDRYVSADQNHKGHSTQQTPNQTVDIQTNSLDERVLTAESVAQYSTPNKMAGEKALADPIVTSSFNSNEQKRIIGSTPVEKTSVELNISANEHPPAEYTSYPPDDEPGEAINAVSSINSANPQKASELEDEPKLATFAIDRQVKAIINQNVPERVLSVKPSNGAKKQLSNLRSQAHIESGAGNDERVIQILKEILTLAPSDQKSRKQLAVLLFSNARVQEASTVLSEGLKIAPAESSLRMMLARALFKSGNIDSAFEVLSQHPYQQIASDELLSLRAALAEKLGLYAQAQTDYQILVNRDPNQAKWWLGLGVSQDKQKLITQALTSYQQAKALNQLPIQVDSFVTKRIQLLTRGS